MKKLTDRSAYLRGLAEGMKLDSDKNETKLIMALIDLVGDMADEVTEISESYEDLNDFVEDLDEDLDELEHLMEEVLGEGDEDEDDMLDFRFADDEDDDDECAGCEGCGEIYAECMCPECGGVFLADADDEGSDALYKCPKCGKEIQPNYEYENDVPIAERVDPDDE